jgi:hypothetical protein
MYIAKATFYNKSQYNKAKDILESVKLDQIISSS